MFPGPFDTVIYNEAGEPLGWDGPTYEADFYCNDCGCIHTGMCPPDYEDDESEDDDAELPVD